MLAFYAFEARSHAFVLAFAIACLASSLYGFLRGAWPLGPASDPIVTATKPKVAGARSVARAAFSGVRLPQMLTDHQLLALLQDIESDCVERKEAADRQISQWLRRITPLAFGTGLDMDGCIRQGLRHEGG